MGGPLAIDQTRGQSAVFPVAQLLSQQTLGERRSLAFELRGFFLVNLHTTRHASGKKSSLAFATRCPSAEHEEID